MKKLKVAILQNGLTYGGTDTFVVNLCRGLDKERFDITVINPCQRSTSPREAEVEAAGIPVVHTTPMAAGNVPSLLRHLRLLYKELRRGRYDVFHTNIDLMNGPQLLVAWLARVPVRICHSHNTQRSAVTSAGEKAYMAVMRALCRLFSNRRSACSREAMELLFPDHEWADRGYPEVISNGIDLTAFQLPHSRRAIEGLGIPDHARIIFTAGRLCEQKNSLFIADIFAALCRRRTDCRLIWAGDGTLRQQVLARLNALGVADRTILLGRRDDVPQLMAAADAFLFPSVFEGLGIALVEAQAAGVPCLASDTVPGFADCGGMKTLPLSAPADEWAAALSDIIDHPDTLHSDPALLDRFSIDTMVSQYSRLLQS